MKELDHGMCDSCSYACWTAVRSVFTKYYKVDIPNSYYKCRDILIDGPRPILLRTDDYQHALRSLEMLRKRAS